MIIGTCRPLDLLQEEGRGLEDMVEKSQDMMDRVMKSEDMVQDGVSGRNELGKRGTGHDSSLLTNKTSQTNDLPVNFTISFLGSKLLRTMWPYVIRTLL